VVCTFCRTSPCSLFEPLDDESTAERAFHHALNLYRTTHEPCSAMAQRLIEQFHVINKNNYEAVITGEGEGYCIFS
jgi:hypothetical protein